MSRRVVVVKVDLDTGDTYIDERRAHGLIDAWATDPDRDRMSVELNVGNVRPPMTDDLAPAWRIASFWRDLACHPHVRIVGAPHNAGPWCRFLDRAERAGT